MMTPRKIPFTKMNGLGNDFVVIDGRERLVNLSCDQVRDLAHRTNPQTKGCDQVLIIEPSQERIVKKGNVFMRIYNADGGEVDACGNGARAVTKYMASKETDNPLFNKYTIETRGGLLAGLTEDRSNWVTLRTTNIRFDWEDIPLTEKTDGTSAVRLHDDLPPAFLVNVGNPHAVIFITEDPIEYAEKYGPQLVNHPLFSKGANINFARIEKNTDSISLATWERGVGLTPACGTGANATTIAAFSKGYKPHQFKIYPPYTYTPQASKDTHYIRTKYNEAGKKSIDQKGPVAFEFEGEAEL